MPLSSRPCLTALPAALPAACLVLMAGGPAGEVRAQDVSRPAILQYFESTYADQADHASALRGLGYGAIWIPPTGRADLTDFSVGYDVFDRFDLGSAARPTLYGTESGLRALTDRYHRAGLEVHADLIWNHAGFSDRMTPGFIDAGAYPGLLITAPDRGLPDGDFHPASATGDLDFRLSGLVDLDQNVGISVIRQPTTAGDSRNIPAGTTPDPFGRLSNVPDPANARFYPGGVAVPETSTEYLMRNARWLVEDLGIDGFRVDAAKHFPAGHLANLDQALAGANPRPRLDGSTAPVFTYSEVLDGNRGFVASYNNASASRTVLDYPQFFALRDNLTNNGLQNDWRNLVNAGMDVIDDGFHNGSSGVLFADNHDVDENDKVQMSNVAHAYVLTQPGDAVVYFNAGLHGDNRDFPAPGREDALEADSPIGRLVDLRNSHGRGDYRARLTQKETFVMERSGSMLAVFSNRNDAGFDARTVATDFAPGTLLVELTGNAAADPSIPEVVTANAAGQVQVRALRNDGQDKGYLVYGLAAPQASGGLELADAGTPDAALASVTAADGSTLAVVNGDQLTATLRTDPVTVSGSMLANGVLTTVNARDTDADGDNALLRLDAGFDLNGSGGVDNTAPGSVAYGFENFAISQPGAQAADGAGLYQQTFDVDGLDEGEHDLTARIFRRGSPGSPAIYTDVHQRIYIDREAADVDLLGINPIGGQGDDFSVALLDDTDTASRVYRFFDLPAAFTDDQVLGLINNGRLAKDLGSGLFGAEGFNLLSGNHTLTTITEEITGRQTIQRFVGLEIASSFGSGLGDLDGDGVIESSDLTGSNFALDAYLASDNTRFTAAGDVTGDGLLDTRDLFGLGAELDAAGVAADVFATYRNLLDARGDVNDDGVTDTRDIDFIYDARNDGFGVNLGAAALDRADLNEDGIADDLDALALIQTILMTGEADANLDRAVNLADFAALAAAFGQSGTAYASGDFNGDGSTNLGDFAVLGRNFGLNFAGDAAIGFVPLDTARSLSLPEPGTALLLGGAGLILARRRR